MRYEHEDGQSILLVALAMGLFLLGAVGLGVDGSHVYAQRNLAQNAADSAAIAGVMSIFDGTTGASGTGFSTSSGFTCTTTDTRTPCAYAAKNGFGGTAADTVAISFPASAPGVNTSAAYSVTLVKVDISRNVNTTLMRLLGATLTTVKATATAAIVDVTSPVPIIVMHPSHIRSFDLQGTPVVKICGGPSRSIQVNSGNATAAATGGNATVDLSKAGPLDTAGTCTTGTGADFGVWGGPTSPTLVSVNYGTKPGHYVQPASILQDPLRNVAAPPIPTNTGTMGTHPALANGVSGCPASPGKACELYHPGLYPSGINANNSTAVFAPGIYYLQSGGIDCHNNCDIYMATGITDSGTNTTNTGWDGTQAGGGVLFYGTGAGQFRITANATATLIGSPAGSSYKGILFFEDHTAASNNSDNSPNNPHKLGGGGQMTLIGTIYLTNTRATMLTTPTKFQELDLSGGSGSGTQVEGEIIVDSLQLGGTGNITMNLNSNASYVISQVALVN